MKRYRNCMRHEVGPSVCSSVENPDLVFLETGDSQGPIRLRPAKCDIRQAMQTRPDHPDRVVSTSGGLPVEMRQVAPTSDRSVCYEVQQPITSICDTDSRHPSLGSGCTQPALGGPGSLCLPTISHHTISKVVEKLQSYPCLRNILIAPGWPNMPAFGC